MHILKTGAVITGLLINAVVYSQNFTINGRLSGFNDGTKFYVDEVHTQQTIAETTIKDGRFEIKGVFSEFPVMILLKAVVDDKIYPKFILMGAENVTVTGSIKDYPFHINVTGSKYQAENELLLSKTQPFDILRDSVSQNIFDLIKDTSATGRNRIYTIAKQQAFYDHITDSITVAFISAHLNTYAAVNQLYYLRKKFSKDSVEIMYNSLDDELKESVFGRKIFIYLKVGSILKTGDMASGFEAEDQWGKKHNLSAYFGKWILLDFMETYCAPCVASVPDIRTVYNKLIVISFCADKKKDTWLKGIKRDKPDWLCVWDGKGPASETPLKYGVSGYPMFVLINPSGKIVSKLSGYAKGDIEKLIKDNLPLN